MRNSFSVVMVFGVIVAATLSGCSKQPTPNANGNASAVAEPTPDKAAIEAQLKALELDWPRIIKERDGGAVRRLEADDIVLIYPDGSEGSKEKDIKDIESGEQEAQDISDVTVEVLSNDTAVVRSRTTLKGDSYKIGDPKYPTIIHEFRTVDTFVRRNGQWQIVASVTVPVANPAPPAPSSSKPGASASPKLSPTASASPSGPTP